MAADDPTTTSLWRPLRLLLTALDDEIAIAHSELGITGIKPSWAQEILRLRADGPMTITELAAAVQRTHSALSQKVSAMEQAGLVTTRPAEDARAKQVELTEKARQITDQLVVEWNATEAALAELEAELPYPLSRVVEDIEAALAHRSFHERVLDHAEHPRT